MSTLEALFSGLVSSEPSRPFVTFYDEGSGERAELSVRSLANWVAKTHHLLGDELGLGEGSRALIALPAHWISVPALLGALTAGLELVTAADGADVAFVSPATVERAAGVPDVYAVAPASAAVGFGAGVPAGAEDYVTAVRPQADKWVSVHLGAGPEAPCVDGRTRAETVQWARSRAGELGLAPGARVLATRDWSGPQDWVDTLLAPLAVGGSLVYVRNCTDPAALDRRAGQERVTVRV